MATDQESDGNDDLEHESSLLSVDDSCSSMGPLADYFRKRKALPAISSVEVLREVVRMLNEAIGEGPGSAELELEETGREGEVRIADVGPVEGLSVEYKGAVRKLKIKVERRGAPPDVIDVDAIDANRVEGNDATPDSGEGMDGS